MIPETAEVSDPIWQVKPKPATAPDGMTIARCSKCGGNGIFAMAIMNGRPWSATGTTCWKCEGRGWIFRRLPRRRTKERTAA